MNRRSLLAGIVGSLCTISGCTESSTRLIEIQICNYTPDSHRGEVKITDIQDSTTVSSVPFSLPKEIPCIEFEKEIQREGSYEFYVELENGLTESYTWGYEDAIDIQIKIMSDEIVIKELQVPNP